MQKISSLIRRIANPIYEKKNFKVAIIFDKWSEIVGEEYGRNSYPSRISTYKYGDSKNRIFLHVNVSSSSVAVQMNFIKNLLVEKIANYIGYKLVDDIKFIHLTNIEYYSPKFIAVPKLAKEKEALLKKHIDVIEEEKLKDILHNLGSFIFNKETRS